MSVTQETIDTTPDSNGRLRLAQQPRLPPGPVQVTIRAAAAGPQRGLADMPGKSPPSSEPAAFPGGRRKGGAASMVGSAARW